MSEGFEERKRGKGKDGSHLADAIDRAFLVPGLLGITLLTRPFRRRSGSADLRHEKQDGGRKTHK